MLLIEFLKYKLIEINNFLLNFDDYYCDLIYSGKSGFTPKNLDMELILTIGAFIIGFILVMISIPPIIELLMQNVFLSHSKKEKYTPKLYLRWVELLFLLDSL